METAVKKLYEAMFLVDSALAASDWDGINKAIKKILEKVNADLVSLRKWDERLLAYPVNGKVRGTYLLCYFQADGDKIQTLEREIRLSDTIMRVLILKADHMTQEDVDKETPVGKIERKRQEAIEAAKTRAEEAKQAEKPEKAEQTEKPIPQAESKVVEPEPAEKAEQTEKPIPQAESEVAEPEPAEKAEQTEEPEEAKQTEKPEKAVAVDAIENNITEKNEAQDSDSPDQQEPEEDQIENTDEDTKE